uniref:Ribonuclease A-domain domain-containing protein n=1 Tax=Chrysemys picta bellii TaxID=8478 RepID=A0A8C3I0Z9_CHRPI
FTRIVSFTISLLLPLLNLLGHIPAPHKQGQTPLWSEDSNGTYCDTMMQHREMYGQEANTFIHAPIGSINGICNLGGTPGKPNERHSVAPFDITVCAFNSTSRTYAGTRYVRRIVLACLKGLPIDYVRHI